VMPDSSRFGANITLFQIGRIKSRAPTEGVLLPALKWFSTCVRPRISAGFKETPSNVGNAFRS